MAPWWRIRLPIQELQEMWIQSLNREDPLEEEMATHSSRITRIMPWTEEPGGLYSPWGCRESAAEQSTAGVIST